MAYITPDGTIVETSGDRLFPTANDLSSSVGGEISDLSLVPELDASTKGYWQAFGPGLGLREIGGGVQPQAKPTVSPPWLVIGGIGILAYSMLKKKR
jgi:hypothetical protein